jgi:hypothetical protein
MPTKFKDRPKNLFLNRALVAFAFFGLFNALWWTNMSTQESEFIRGSKIYIYENLGTAGLIIYAVIPVLLSLKYPLYWVFFSTGDIKSADEQQASVRRRVYERSYRLFGSLGIFSYLFFGDSDDHRMNLVLAWSAVITFFVLPIVVAAWQKDS